ncbi:peptidoglycan DD-metalloendopeptidase family protein [Ectobacillus antri]|uniref:Peptidoglycan DD-metalloendopeptidase family protein n=1 Tax=Ectobacillus antri TaxID=2486280 RepID=A0ABT6H7K9_9BACI|nr:M23 family metallopeptidase [Ectobacillus antri]MDG4658241.1 peptidoglycan DD-metalloendopeptidase family protein [Ectobacillus antri]MDG5755327.1 peptidoglycan DD-metalloendopeptidase family protein [Ectobacillus antri]
MTRKAIHITLLTSMIAGAFMLPVSTQANTDVNTPQNRLHENQVEGLQKEIESFKQQLEQLDQAIVQTAAELESTQNQINETQAMIANKAQNITMLREKISQRQEVIKKRLVTLQDQPKSNLITDVLLHADSIADLLDNMYSLNLIFQSDKTILDDQKTDQEKLKNEKNSIEEQELALRSSEAYLLQKQQQLEQSQQDKKLAIQTLEQQFNANLSALIDADEEKRLLESQGIVPPLTGDTELFIKPAVGSFSSGFGMRGNENHKGVDIAASGPVPIVASATGTVIRSEYSSSYGNVVYMSHNIAGKSYTTVYAHMRSRSVQQGQIVQQGQQIGIMGNTGISFGQHLHFEIHIGSWNAAKSNAVDPMKFLK